MHGNCALQTCGTQNSARQLCAANLRRTLCTRTVRDNCALQTCGAHCVPEQCATIVRCKLAAHIVCQNSARQLCASYCGAHCVPEQCARKVICIRKHVYGKLAATVCCKLAARLLQVCGIYVPETLYFGKGKYEI